MTLGVLFRLTDTEIAPLLDTDLSDDDILSVLDDFEENEQIFAKGCETDKAWEAIHATLCPNDTPVPFGPFGVIGGRELLTNSSVGWFNYKQPKEVELVANYLLRLNNDQFQQRYLSMPHQLRSIEFGPTELTYCLEWLQSIRDFYHQAAAEKDHVVFSVHF